MSGLPSGTVTFLFTDIEGSTRFWEQMPDEMAIALAKHDEILRLAIESNGGYVFKTVGDAFCAAFSQASSATAAVLDIQKSLSQLDSEPIQLKVRMALHSGTAEERGGDYFGPTLNRTARILAVGHGGQVLLSEVCQTLVRESLPAEGSLKSLGVHRLKDLGLPETIYQFEHSTLPSDFPALKSLGTHSSSLPQYLSRFIGREKELEQVKKMAAESRLSTLTGSGGCGKTRLATQAAAELADSFGDGVWFFEFAPLSDPTAIPSALAETLSIKPTPSETPLQAVQQSIGDQAMLLVFDNCEHVLDEASAVAASLLKNCPKIHILATSREALGIDGERTYRVPSLQVPDLLDADAEVIRSSESVQLFVDRARLANPDFWVSDAEARPLASICSRLDGIPLAIELAAARTRIMSVEQIEQNLDQRFRLLTGGSRTALPRQQTLRSLIEWSHNLLSGQEKTLFRRLSVFAGSWTLEAAKAVCAGDDLDTWEVMDLMASLIDKSLVIRIEGASPDRYRFLETIRQYARDQLMEEGESLTFHEKHFYYFASLAPDSSSYHSADLIPIERQELVREQENLIAAQEYAEGQKTYAEAGLELANGMAMFWWAVGRLRYGLRHLKANLNLVEGPSDQRALAFFQSSRLSYLTGEYLAAVELAQLAEAEYSAIGNLAGVCNAMNSRANAMNSLGDPAHLPIREAALEIAKEHGFQRLEGKITANISIHKYYQGDVEGAREGFEQVLAGARAMGSPGVSIAVMLNNLGEVSTFCGEMDRAAEYFDEALRILIADGAAGQSTYSFDGIAHVMAFEDKFSEAIRLIGCANAVRESRGSVIPPYEADVIDKTIERCRERMSQAEFDEAWAAGRAMNLEAGWDFARRVLEDRRKSPD
jgi:predicted ATPase/class 3 adenylate cyclase